MDIEEYHQGLLDVANQAEQTVKSLAILKDILTPNFFEQVRKQLDYLRKDRGGKIHPLFNLLLRHDGGRAFEKVNLLEDYLERIFGHPSFTKYQRNHIKAQIRSFDHWQSLNMLSEIAVLGCLFKQVPTSHIKLYQKTVGNSDVDVIVRLKEREIFVEITVLGDSDYHQRILEDLVRSGSQKVFTGDIPKDARRIRSRIEEKENRFFPGRPNVVILFLMGSWVPLPIQLWDLGNLSNIGLIMQFNRYALESIVKEGCDPECLLNDEEQAHLTSLLGKENFTPLIY